ncbi:hypothetical protein [Nocardia abscessus]|uniref:hypothetical protein n=1 Tax=Nocardia abscessus TaxID=120957 RepID=UPI0024556B9F|nr:hypothetical protein [Nocardia abscessus]
MRRSEPPQFYTPIGGDDDIVRVVPRTEQTYDWRDNDDHGIYATLDPFEGVMRVRMRVSDGPTEAATMFGNAMSELGGHWVNEIQGEWQREGASDALDADQRDLYRTAEEAVARTLLGRLAAEHGFTEVRIEPADSGDNTVPIVRFTKPEFAPADTVSTPDDADAPDRTDDGSPQPAADDAADPDRTADQREQTDTDERKTEDLWQLEPVDIATDQVWQILEQNAIGREAARVLRAEGARVRFADLGDEIGEADAFDRRTMDIAVDTHDRGQVELAGELVRLAALTEAIRDGQVEVTPARIRGTTREDYVAAQLRADAAAIGRQAEFLRQLEQAGYPGRPTAMAPIDVNYRRAMHQQYLDAYDAAVSRVEQADPPVDAERLRERGRAAGVDALLAGELFDGSWSDGESASARNAHGRDWDAAQRMDIPSDVYRPATAEAARDTQALLRRHAALNREIGRFDAMRDRLIPHLEGFDPENNVFDRQALRPDRSLLAHLQDLAQARLEVGDDQLSLFQTQVRVLTDLAAERTRVVEARDRLALELAARVGHDLMDRQVDEAGGSWLTDRAAWVPGPQPKLFVAETGDRYTRVTGDEAPFTSVRETLWYQDVVADRVWVDIDDSGDVRLRRQETDPRDVWSEEDGRWMRERPEARRAAPRSPDRSATEEPTPTGRTAEQKTPAEHAAERLDRALLELDGDNRRVYMNMRGERVRGEGNYPGRWAMSTVDRHGIEVRFTLEDQPAARDGRQVLRSGTGYVPSADAIVLHLNSSALKLAETIVHAAAMADRTRAAGGGTLERVTLSRDEYISTMLDRQAEAHARAFEFTRVRDRRNSYRSEDERTPDEPRTVEHNDRLRQSYDEARKKARKVAARAYKGNSSVRDTMLDAAAFRAAVREVRAALVERGPLIDGVDYATYYAAEWDRANGFTAADLNHAPDPHKQDSPELRRMRTADFAVEIETLRMLRDSGRFVPVGPAETAYTQAYDRAYRKARRADDGTPPERRAMDAGLAALRKYVDKVGLPEAEIAMEVARSGADNQGEYQPWPLDDDPSTRTRVATEEVGDLGAARRAIAALLDRYPEGVRLTERIALLPDERWDGQRLVIAAQRGGHIDALRELSVRHAEYSDVLWAGTQNRQYLLVTPGEEDGRTRWLNSGEAEGAYRAPSRHETMEQFLAHYLRYRLARRTDLGFQSWLRQLGPEMFHTKKDQREADAHEAYEGRANKGTLRPDALRSFRTEPEVDEPHPAVVAHRLATRQVPLPTSWGRGVSWPRSTLGRIEIADYTFGIVLEADGNGGWRVPAPNGDGGLDDALSQLFQGMSDKSPKRLANRIASMLDDGGADLIRREPRGRLRRMAGRLSLGSRNGQDDAPRAIDAGESEHNPPQFGPPRPPDPDEGRRAEADQRRAVLERLAAENRAAVRERDAARAADDPERLAGAEERVERLDRAMAAALERDALLRAGARPITDRVGVLAGEPPMVLVVNLGGTDSALALTEVAAQYPEVARALDRAARPRELRVDADGTIRVVPFASRADGPEHPASAPPQRDGVAEPGDPVDVSRQPEDIAEPGGSDTAQPASGDGGAEKPPTTPPSADEPGDEPGPRSDWYFQMRIEQADWEADMAADHAAWLRELADARPDDRWARLRAEQAEWNARMAADRAAWLRLEQAQHEAWTAAVEADRSRRAADADADDPWAELRAQQAEWDARMAEDRAQWLRRLYTPIGTAPQHDSGAGTSDSASPARPDPTPSADSPATPTPSTPPRAADESRTGDADGSDDPRDRMSPETRAEYDRLAAELEQAQARRDELRRQRDDLAGRLPIDDADDWAALRPGPDGLDRTLEDLRGRTMPVTEMPERLTRIDALEQAARDFADADAEVARLETELANLELSTTPLGEYDRLVQQRQKLTREREFWRAKRDDRAARCDFWGDNVTLDESALRGDQLEATVLQLYEAANVRTIDDIGGLDDAPHTDRVAPEPLELEHRRLVIEKLAAAAEQVNRLDEQIDQVDRRIDQLRRAGVGVERSRPQDVIDALEELAQQRADALREVKPLRHERDDLAARLGLLDPEGRVDQAACEPDRLDRTVADLRAAVRDGLADGTLSDDEAAARRRDIDALDAVARQVNNAHNAIGRIQDDMARVAGAYRDLVERGGGRMVTDRVGIVDGERPRVIVFGPRPDPDAPRADHDAALADALRRSSDVAQAIVRPETTVEYRRVLADRADNVRVEEMDPPEIERLSTGWIGGRRLDITSWRDADGVWHHVDPTRPDWEFGRDRSELPKKFTPKDPPDGVSGWAMEDVVNDITLPTDDVPPGKVPESALPVHMPQAPSQYDTSGVDPNDLFSQHWGADSYNVVRLLLMAAQVPKHPAVKAWIQRHPEIGEWVQARPWLQHLPPFGTVFRNYAWFAPPQRNIQPMHRPWNAADHVPPGDRVDIPEGLQREWDRDIAAWQRVQDWANAEYQRFLADDTDLDGIADGIERHRRAEQETRAREVVDTVERQLVQRQPGIDPLGDVDAQLRRIHDEIDRVAGELADRFAADDPDAVRDTVEDIRELLAGGGDPDRITAALAEHMRVDAPKFTREELAQIKNHLMADEHRVRDHADPHGRYVHTRMDRLADVAEAWNRLIDGAPLPQDFVLLGDMLAEARFLAANPGASWQQANAHAIALGFHWDADRPPLTGWRAGIPYAPAPLPPNPGYLPPAPGALDATPPGPQGPTGDSAGGADRRLPTGQQPRSQDEAEGPAQKPSGDPSAVVRQDESDGSGEGERGVPRADGGARKPSGDPSAVVRQDESDGSGDGEQGVPSADGGARKPPEVPSAAVRQDGSDGSGEGERGVPSADGGAQKPPEDPPATARQGVPDEPGDGERAVPEESRVAPPEGGSGAAPSSARQGEAGDRAQDAQDAQTAARPEDEQGEAEQPQSHPLVDPGPSPSARDDAHRALAELDALHRRIDQQLDVLLRRASADLDRSRQRALDRLAELGDAIAQRFDDLSAQLGTDPGAVAEGETPLESPATARPDAEPEHSPDAALERIREEFDDAARRTDQRFDELLRDTLAQLDGIAADLDQRFDAAVARLDQLAAGPDAAAHESPESTALDELHARLLAELDEIHRRATDRLAELERELDGPTADPIEPSTQPAPPPGEPVTGSATRGVDPSSRAADGAVEGPARTGADAEPARPSAQRDAAARELADAQVDLADARRGLPVYDEDLTRDALDDALEGLRSRTMRVDEQGPWLNRVAELERAARRVFDAEDELSRLDDALAEATRAVEHPSNDHLRESVSHAAHEDPARAAERAGQSSEDRGVDAVSRAADADAGEAARAEQERSADEGDAAARESSDLRAESDAGGNPPSGPPTPPANAEPPAGGGPAGPRRTGNPVRDVVEFLREQRDWPNQREAGPLTEAEVEHVRLLAEALGLDETFTVLRDPLAALAELAELARARGFLDDADGPRMRYPDDFEPLTSDERYGDEQFWLAEAPEDGLREVRDDLRRVGLPIEQPRPPQLPAAPTGPGSLPPVEPGGRVASADPSDPAPAGPERPSAQRDAASGEPADAQVGRAETRRGESVHPSAQRDAAARELADAQADLANARRGLPVNDGDLTRDALDDALDGLRSRTMRVDEQRPWQDRVAELERAARRVFDAEDEVARLDDALAQPTRPAESNDAGLEVDSGRTQLAPEGAARSGEAPASRAPRPEPIDRTRDRLARRFALDEADLSPENLGATIADLRYRNLLRAGMVEALAAATERARDTVDPDLRAQATATRDTWARRLRIDPAHLDRDPDATVAGARAAVRRDAESIADLADAARAARSRTGAEPPEPGETRRYTLEVDDERVPARLVADENDGWRVEVPERLDAPEPANTNAPAPRQPERPMSRLRRLWEALQAGFRGQNPKYPSGSGIDSAGQSLLGHEAGLPLTKHYDPTPTPGDEYDVLQTKFNPARILKETVTMWRKRELIPLLKRLTSRVASRAAEYDTPTTRDGEEYRYWLEEADPELVRRELGVELEDLKRQAEDVARALPAPEARPEPSDGETPDTTTDQSTRPGEELPASTGELADWLHELSEASARCQELADALAAAADALGVDLGEPNAENVRRAADLLRYQHVRRIGSLTGLAEASRRYNAEHERIPFSEQIGFFDANPMNRFLGEVVRAFGGNPTLLNWEGVNNGGEPSREWGDLYDTDQPGQDQGLRAFFENALRRDQIMDERSVWAQLLGTDLHALDPNQLADALAEEMDRIREHARGLAGFLADAEEFLLADAAVDEFTGLIGDMAGREWVLAQGGVLLEDGTGLGLVPGEPGEPMRLVVVDGRLDHDRVIADALAEHPRLAEAVNEGIVEVHYLISDVQPGRPLPEGGFTPERIALVDGGATQVRHFTGAVEGRRLEATVVNDGDGWRVVPDAPMGADALPAEAPESLSRAEIGAAIDELAARLGITEAELDSPELLAERLAVLRDENAIRAGQIEAIIDYARTAWDIDTYHQVGDARNLLTHRLGLEPAEMTPRRLAETIADPDTRNALRQQRAEALVKYAKLLRGIDPDAIDAADDRLVRRLDALPGTVRITGIAQLGEVIANLSQRPNLHPNLVDALTDYADALARVDVFDPDAHGDRAIDPRVSDIEFPVHDKAVRHLLDVIGDVTHLTEAPARLGMLDGDTGIPPGPDRGASRDFARLVGVDLTDAGPERWAEVYEVYRDGKLDQNERLTPAQQAGGHGGLRAEVVPRAAGIAAHTSLSGAPILAPMAAGTA